jgi:2-dehydropantoate 2-reductase
MNIIVLGAGAIGCYVGGRLAAAGECITLVGRPRTVEPIALSGLTVTDLQGFKAHIAADINAETLSVASSLKLAMQHLAKDQSAKDQHTVVLLCVKGGATLSAAQEIAECCPAGSTVVSLQNGVDNVARIKSATPQMQVFAGMVPYNVVMKTAAHVHRTSMGKIYIEQSEVTAELVAKFNAAGLLATTSTNMRAVQWGKLLLNVNNPVNALSDLPLREQFLNRDFRYVFATLQLEALSAMRAAGIEPLQLAAVKPHIMPYLLKLPNFIFTRLAKKMLRMDPSARSSMWDDIQLGRITEVEDMCGAIVRLAKLVDTKAPSNEAMCRLIAKHTKGHRLTGKELRLALKI